MKPFAPRPDRDAYATIRGFVYQVDLTIQRWLGLAAGQSLELESGEDIDLVADALSSATFSTERLMEQVKHRESSLTLRSPSVLETIANAFEHRAENPGHVLFLRFSTNATIGKERSLAGQTLPSTPLLTLWEQLRSGELSESKRSAGVATIRTFLISLTKPKEFTEEAWIKLQSSLGQAEIGDMLDLIEHVEWSTGGKAAGSMQGEVESLLRGRGTAVDEVEAEQLYQRLFLRVFKLLCEKGTKRLTLEDLADQIALPTLSATDHALLGRVIERVDQLQVRVGNLEALTSSIDQAVSGLVERESITAELLLGELPRTDPPELPDRLAGRGEVVRTLIEALEQATWLTLYGGEDEGKTILARLVAQERGGNCIWIRLDSSVADRALVAQLERTLAESTGISQSGDRRDWYVRVAEALGAKTLIVIDPTPSLVGRPELCERLQNLTTACKARDVRLLTVGTGTAPAGVVGALPVGLATSIPVPAFSEAEAAELLRAYGAPESRSGPKSTRFLKILTGGHPVLLAAVAAYLRARDWAIEDEVLSQLLQGGHAEDITEELIQRLMDSVTQRARDLLYRLSLVRSAFTLEEVEAVGRVAPTISHRREALAEVTGPWVRRLEDKRYEVSPLINQLGESTLDPEIKLACHGALGEHLVRGRTIGMVETLRALNHFQRAEQFNKAAILFLAGLLAVKEADDHQIGEPLISLWEEVRMPTQIDASIRLLARSYQLFLRSERDLSSDAILADIEGLFGEIDAKDGWAIVGAAVFAGLALTSSNPIAAHSFLSRAIGSWEESRTLGGRPVQFPEGVGPEKLLWGTIPHLTRDEEFLDWLRRVESLPEAVRDNMFSGNDGILGCLVLADRVLACATQKPNAEPDLAAASVLLDRIAEAARGLGLDSLRAATVRSRIRLESEILNRHDVALELASQVGGFADARDRYLIQNEMARQLTIARRYDEAREWIARAIGNEPTDFPNDPMLLRVAASTAFGHADPEDGVRYAEEAVALGKTAPEFAAAEVAAAACERALAFYYARGLDAAYPVWQEAAGLVFGACDEESNTWKCVFVTFSHATSFMVSMVTNGSPPSIDVDGSPLIELFRGMFFYWNDDIARLYEPKKRADLAYLLGQWSDRQADYDNADAWYEVALAQASAPRARQTEALANMSLTLSRVFRHKWDEAIDASRMATMNLSAYSVERGTGRDENRPDFDVDAAAAHLPEEAAHTAERVVAEAVVLPAVIHLLDVALDAPGEAAVLAAGLSAACRRSAAISSEHILWEVLAELIEMAFQGNASRPTILERIKAPETLLVTQLVGRLCGAQAGDVSQALMDHLAIMQATSKSYVPNKPVYCRLLLPYVERFWRDRITNRRFQLNGPDAVSQRYQEALLLAEERRLRAILSAALSGVVIKNVPNEIRAWLQEK